MKKRLYRVRGLPTRGTFYATWVPGQYAYKVRYTDGVRVKFTPVRTEVEAKTMFLTKDRDFTEKGLASAFEDARFFYLDKPRCVFP